MSAPARSHRHRSLARQWMESTTAARSDLPTLEDPPRPAGEYSPATRKAASYLAAVPEITLRRSRNGNRWLRVCPYVNPFRRCSNLRPIVHEWVDCALFTTPGMEKTECRYRNRRRKASKSYR